MSQRYPTVPPGADPLLVVDASGGSEVVTLTRMTPGLRLRIERRDSAGANTVTVTAPSPLTLDGVAGGSLTLGVDTEIRLDVVDGGFESFGGGALAAGAPVASSATSGTLTAGAEHNLSPASAAAWTLPTGVASSAWPTTVKNNGTATLTIARGGADTINGGTASISVAAGEWARFVIGAAGAWVQSGTAGLSSTYAQKWRANAAYNSGDIVVNPSGQLVSANTTFTSGSSYNSANWTVVSGASGTGSLRRWKYKLATDPTNAKWVRVGDSTQDAATGASVAYRRLLSLHTQPGEALYGLGSTDVFTDGVANGTTTFTSATANFTSADVNRYIHARYLPVGTYIASVTNSTTVVLNQAASGSGTSLKTFIGRHLISGGNNGMTLSQWFGTPSGNSWPFNRDALVAANPDLIEYSWLFNDIRQGGLGLTVAACVTAGTALLKSLLDWTIANLPGADIVLRMPNTMLSADLGAHLVTDGTTTNPAGQAQIYSTALRRTYLSFIGYASNIEVIDTQAEIFGTICPTSSPMNVDQLHPSVNTTGDLYALTPGGGGYAAIADLLAARCGFTRNAFSSAASQRVRSEFIVYDGPSAGSIRLVSRDAYGLPAPQMPVFKSADNLYVQGLDGPIALTSATIDRTFSSTVLTITGLGSTDFSPYIGNTATVTGTHAKESTGDRQQIFIDLPSIAAGATVTQTVAVTGVGLGNVGVGTGVVASPGPAFIAGGLLLLGCFPRATDSITLVINNPTGSPVDVAGESWTFWVMR